MMSFIYKVVKKIKFYFYKKYITSKLNFTNTVAKKSIKIVGENIEIANCNVVVGENVVLYDNVHLQGAGKISIGNNVKIGTGVVINAYKDTEICIGDYTLIAAYCYLINQIHGTSSGKHICEQDEVAQSIFIGEDCWVAAHCVISNGGQMRNGSVLGALSYLDKELDYNSIAVGAPAKHIRYR